MKGLYVHGGFFNMLLLNLIFLQGEEMGNHRRYHYEDIQMGA